MIFVCSLYNIFILYNYYRIYRNNMPSQIFKNPVPNELLKQLLDENAVKTETGYTINNCAYKRGIFNGTIVKFLEECRQ